MDDDIAQLRAVFRRTLAMYQPVSAPGELQPGAPLNGWDWGPGVAIFSLQRAYPWLDAADQQAYFALWREWFGRYLESNPPTIAVNSAMPLRLLWVSAHDLSLPLSEEERDYYQGYVRERVAFYLREASRVPSGAFGHPIVGGNPVFSRQVWADSLFTLVMLIAQVAATKENRQLFGQMVGQLELHFEHLRDPASGLLYHGWQAADQSKTGSNLNGAIWGRGNGWAAMGIADMLELAAIPGFEEYRDRIAQVGQPFFRALLDYQIADGGWRTLLDKEWSYPETSATAGIGYGLLKAARLGMLGPDYSTAGQKALAALRPEISPSGEVQNVSGSTPFLDTLEAYNNVPHDSINTWGQGIALLALTEKIIGQNQPEAS